MSLSPEWIVADEQSDLVTLEGPAELGFIVVTDATMIDDIQPPFSLVHFPDDFVTWVKSDTLFQIVKTQPVTIGGFSGILFDATGTAACNDTQALHNPGKRDWIYLQTTGWNCRPDEHWQFTYLDDVNGKHLLIINSGGPATAEQFSVGAEASQKVFDTVVFSKPAAAVPAAPQLVEYKIPTSASEPGGIVTGPDGALWFVETAVNKIGRISTNGVVTEYVVPTAGAIDTDQGFLAVDADGALWFNEDLVNKIGRITPKGDVTEFALPESLKPTQDDAPIRAIVAGPDGALWVTSPGANAIVKLTTDGKIATKYILPKAGSNPVGMVVGPDGALWFVETGVNQIGRITLDGKLSEFGLLEDSKALRITVGSDKALWFTMYTANKIGRIGTDGEVTMFDAAGMGPVGITSGADGALWFTGYASTEIGRMTTDGKLTKMQIPTTASVPYHIAAGPDGSLWFTEQQGNKIGQIQLSAPTVAQEAAQVPTAKVLAEWKINMPEDIVFGFNSVWVPSRRSPQITTRIDPGTNQVIAEIQGTGLKSKSAAVTKDAVWVAGQLDDLAPINPKTNTVGAKVPGDHPRIAFGLGSIWAVGHQGEPLDRIDPVTGKIIASIGLGGTVSDGGEENGVFVTANTVWVINNGEFLKIDPSTNTVAIRTTFDKMIAEAKTQTTVPAGKGTDFVWLGSEHGLIRVNPNTGKGLTLLADVIGDIPLAVTDNVVWTADAKGLLSRVNVATNQVDATYKISPNASRVVTGLGSLWLAYTFDTLVQRLDVVP